MPVRFSFEGTANPSRVFPPLVSAGDAIRGHFDFHSDAPGAPVSSLPVIGMEYAADVLAVEIPAAGFAGTCASVAIVVSDGGGPTGNDVFAVIAEECDGPLGPLDLDLLTLILDGADGPAVVGNSLPLTPPPLAAFEEPLLFFRFGGPCITSLCPGFGTGYPLFGDLERLVAEPPAAGPLALGAAWLVAGRRRRPA